MVIVWVWCRRGKVEYCNLNDVSNYVFSKSKILVFYNRIWLSSLNYILNIPYLNFQKLTTSKSDFQFSLRICEIETGTTAIYNVYLAIQRATTCVLAAYVSGILISRVTVNLLAFMYHTNFVRLLATLHVLITSSLLLLMMEKSKHRYETILN